MEAVERASCISDVVHPLRGRIDSVKRDMKWGLSGCTRFLWLGNHHVTIHEYPGDALGHAREHRRTCIGRIDQLFAIMGGYLGCLPIVMFGTKCLPWQPDCQCVLATKKIEVGITRP